MITIKEEFVGGDKWERAIELGGSDAIQLWLAIKRYAAVHPLDGFIHADELRRLRGRPKNVKRALNALIECGAPTPDGSKGAGLLDIEEHGYRLHDYLDHAASAAEEEGRREKTRRGKALWRAKQLARDLGLNAEALSEDELLSLKRPRGRPPVSANSSESVRGRIRTMSEDSPTDMSEDGASRGGADALARVRPRTQPNPTQPTTTAAADPEPRNLAEALKLPIRERSVYVEGHRHTADWLEPQRWPEVLEIAATHHVGQGFTNTPRLLSYASDEGVKRLVQLFAAGFTLDEIKLAVSTSWWRSEKRSLRQLSPTVIERSLSGVDSEDEAAETRRRAARARQAELDARAAAESPEVVNS